MTAKTWTEMGPRLWEEMRRQEKEAALKRLNELKIVDGREGQAETSPIETAVRGWFSMALLAKRTMSRSEYSEALRVLMRLVNDETTKLQQAVLNGEESEDRLSDVNVLDIARHLLSSMVTLLNKGKP